MFCVLNFTILVLFTLDFRITFNTGLDCLNQKMAHIWRIAPFCVILLFSQKVKCITKFNLHTLTRDFMCIYQSGKKNLLDHISRICFLVYVIGRFTVSLVIEKHCSNSISPLTDRVAGDWGRADINSPFQKKSYNYHCLYYILILLLSGACNSKILTAEY